MEQNIEKCFIYKQVLEFHFEPMDIQFSQNVQNRCTLMLSLVREINLFPIDQFKNKNLCVSGMAI